MQFLLIGYDGKDPEAPERRMKVRAEHLEKAAELKKEGTIVIGGAILNELDQMIGSMIVYDVPDEEALKKVIGEDPYVTGNVWEKIKIHPFRQAKLV